MPVVELTTTGRKSGQPRSVMLTSPVQEGSTIVVVASRGGDDQHPAWFLNLRDKPEVEVSLKGQPKEPMRARIASPEERARLWPLVTVTTRTTPTTRPRPIARFRSCCWSRSPPDFWDKGPRYVRSLVPGTSRRQECGRRRIVRRAMRGCVVARRTRWRMAGVVVALVLLTGCFPNDPPNDPDYSGQTYLFDHIPSDYPARDRSREREWDVGRPGVA